MIDENGLLILQPGGRYALSMYPGPMGPLRTPIMVQRVEPEDGGAFAIVFVALRFPPAGTLTWHLRLISGDAVRLEYAKLDMPGSTVVIALLTDGWLWTHFGEQFLDRPPAVPEDGTDVSVPAQVKYW